MKVKIAAWWIFIILAAGMASLITLQDENNKETAHSSQENRLSAHHSEQKDESILTEDIDDELPIDLPQEEDNNHLCIDNKSVLFESTQQFDMKMSKPEVKIDIPIIEELQIHPLNPISKMTFTLDKETKKEIMEKKPMQGLFETAVSIEKVDHKINIHFSLKNRSGRDLQIFHGSGQRYDIWVYNDENE